jgi:hypothetical protein
MVLKGRWHNGGRWSTKEKSARKIAKERAEAQWLAREWKLENEADRLLVQIQGNPRASDKECHCYTEKQMGLKHTTVRCKGDWAYQVGFFSDLDIPLTVDAIKPSDWLADCYFLLTQCGLWKRLNGEERQIVSLCLEGYTQEEASRSMGLPINTFQRRLTIIRQKAEMTLV